MSDGFGGLDNIQTFNNQRRLWAGLEREAHREVSDARFLPTLSEHRAAERKRHLERLEREHQPTRARRSTARVGRAVRTATRSPGGGQAGRMIYHDLPGPGGRAVGHVRDAEHTAECQYCR
jgi:hypothetical protein